MAKHASPIPREFWGNLSFAAVVLMVILAYALMLLGITQAGKDVTRGWNHSVHTTVTPAVIPPER